MPSSGRNEWTYHGESVNINSENVRAVMEAACDTTTSSSYTYRPMDYDIQSYRHIHSTNSSTHTLNKSECRNKKDMKTTVPLKIFTRLYVKVKFLESLLSKVVKETCGEYSFDINDISDNDRIVVHRMEEKFNLRYANKKNVMSGDTNITSLESILHNKNILNIVMNALNDKYNYDDSFRYRDEMIAEVENMKGETYEPIPVVERTSTPRPTP